MMGPNNSGRSAASYHNRPAGLAVSDHAGLAARLRVRGYHLFDEDGLGAGNISDCLTGNGFGKKSNEVARMTGLECNADLAVGLEAANARTVAGARIDDDKRPQLRIDVDAVGRDDPHKSIIYGPLQLTAVHNQFDLVVEHVRRVFGHVLAILISALTQHIPEQHAALGGIDPVLHCGGKYRKRRHRRLR